MMVASEQATVFIVEDDPAGRESMQWLLGSVGLNVETFDSAQAFLDAYDADRCGCIVLDVRMPGMSGLDLQQLLRDRKVEIPVVMITGFGDVTMAVRAMKTGAVDFLEKPVNDQLLLERVQSAIKRDEIRRAEREESADVSRRFALLTPREREVLSLVVSGRPTKLIAAHLGLSPKTVEIHRSHIMDKMEAEGLAHLVKMCVKIGISGDEEFDN